MYITLIKSAWNRLCDIYAFLCKELDEEFLREVFVFQWVSAICVSKRNIHWIISPFSLILGFLCFYLSANAQHIWCWALALIVLRLSSCQYFVSSVSNNVKSLCCFAINGWDLFLAISQTNLIREVISDLSSP